MSEFLNDPFTIPTQEQPATPPEVDFSIVSNVWVKQMLFKDAGFHMRGHTHPFDHMTLLAKGRVRVTVDGVSTEYEAPKIIFIGKEKEHHLTSLEPDTLTYCIHALRDGERVEDIVADDHIPEGYMKYIVNPPKAKR